MRISLLMGMSLILFTACSEGTDMAGGGKKSDTSKEEDNEKEPISEPAHVSGSFLTRFDCAYMSEPDEAKTSQSVGCTAADQEGNRYDRDTHKFKLGLFDGDERVAMNVTDPQGDKFDMYADLPTEYMKSETAELRMRVETEHDVAVSSHRMDVSDIKGQGELDDGLNAGGTSGGYVPNLTSFETATSWSITGAAKQWVKDKGFQAELFCSSAGATPVFNDTTAQIMTAFAKEMGEDIGSIKQDKLTFGPNSASCFKSFKFVQTDVAHGIYIGGKEMCLVFMVRDTLYVVSKFGKEDDQDLTTKGLKGYIESHMDCSEP